MSLDPEICHKETSPGGIRFGSFTFENLGQIIPMTGHIRLEKEKFQRVLSCPNDTKKCTVEVKVRVEVCGSSSERDIEARSKSSPRPQHPKVFSVKHSLSSKFWQINFPGC